MRIPSIIEHPAKNSGRERKAPEESARSEGRSSKSSHGLGLEETFRAAKIGSLVWDPRKNAFRLDDTLLDMLPGHGESADLDTQDFVDQIHLGDREWFRGNLLECSVSGFDFSGEIRLGDDVGTFECFGSALGLPSSEPRRVVCVMRKTADSGTSHGNGDKKAPPPLVQRISHEIKIPLQAILGYSELLKNDPELNERQKARVDSIVNNAGHLMQIVRDVFAQSVQGQSPNFVRSPFKPAQLLSSLVESFELTIRQRRHRIRIDPESSNERIIADETKIRRILLNLIGNAVKFAPDGEIRLVAGLIGGSGHNAELFVEVADDGMGIPDRDLPHIFSPNYQGGTATDSASGGLGLALCRELAAALNGRLQVMSGPGEGTTFRLQVPVERAESVRGDPPSPGRALYRSTRCRTQSLAESALSGLGFSVDLVGDLEDRLNQTENQYSLVLLHVDHGDEQEMNCLKLLATQARRLDIPVIVISDQPSEAISLAGAAATVVKPVTPGALRTALKAAGVLPAHGPQPNADGKRVPRPLAKCLASAAARADLDHLNALLDRLERTDADLAGGLRQLASQLDYEQLIESLRMQGDD